MNQLLIAAKEIGDFLTHRDWKFCVIGGLAVQRWGEPRTTLDVDITLFTDLGQEENYARILLNHFPSRISDAREFALQHRVLLLRSSNGKDLDIALGALPFEKTMMERAAPLEFAPGILLPCCTAEDLLILKVFAGRPRDELDARSIVARQENLDVGYIRRQLRELARIVDAEDDILQLAKSILQAKT